MIGKAFTWFSFDCVYAALWGLESQKAGAQASGGDIHFGAREGEIIQCAETKFPIEMTSDVGVRAFCGSRLVFGSFRRSGSID